MKKLILGLIVLLMYGASAFAQTPDDLVLWAEYNFDLGDPMADTGGNGYDIMAIGTNCTVGVELGYCGQAYHGTGGGSYAEIPIDAWPTGGDVTFEMMVYFDVVETVHSPVIICLTPNKSTGHYWMFEGGSWDDDIFMQNYNYWGYVKPSWYSYLSGSRVVEANHWYHVVHTQDSSGEVKRAWVDGELWAENSFPGLNFDDIDYGTFEIYIGSQGGISYLLKGKIDMLRIYTGYTDTVLPLSQCPPPITVATIDPCSLSVTEDPCDTPTDTYTITITESIPSDCPGVRVFLDPEDLSDAVGAQVSVAPGPHPTDPNNALNVLFTTANWETPQTITITAFDDAVGELDKTITLQNSLIFVSPYSADPCTEPNWVFPKIKNADLDVLVIDDDQLYAIEIDEVDPCGIEVSEQGSTSDTYTVVVKKIPTTSIDILIQTDGQTTVDPCTLTFTSANWNTPQTVSVTAVDDSVGEDDPHTGTISHSVPFSVNWNTTLRALDTFDSDPGNVWSNETNVDDPYDVNSVVAGGVLKVYGSTMAEVPGDYDFSTVVYQVTVTFDFSDSLYNVMGVRNDGTQVNYSDPCVPGYIAMGYNADQDALWIDGGEGSSIYEETVGPIEGWGTDPDTYKFTIEDYGALVYVKMESTANPAHYLEVTANGLAGLYSGQNKVVLGFDTLHDSNQSDYYTYDDLTIKGTSTPLTQTQEQVDWATAQILYASGDGEASVKDNDCRLERATLTGDIDNDCDVDLADFAAFAGQFLDCLKPSGGLCY